MTCPVIERATSIYNQIRKEEEDMAWLYSTLTHEDVWVDPVDDYNCECDECGEEIEGEPMFEDGSPLCPTCYEEIF